MSSLINRQSFKNIWDTFSGDTKIMFVVDCLKKILEHSKYKPFTSKELNKILKSVYKQPNYATNSGLWNGGSNRMTKKIIKNFIKITLQPSFTNKIIKELVNKVNIFLINII